MPPYTKPALTYDEQLALLKSRGLKVENESKAVHLLKTISYYRLSGYFYPMLSIPKTDHLFKPDSTFNNGFKLYCFDRELRKLVIAELEKIEVAIRAIMIYTLSHHHGPFWFQDRAVFKKQSTFNSTMQKLNEEYSRTDEIFIQEFQKKYSDPLPPSWMMLEIISFGSLSLLYQNLKDTHDRRSIARYFGLDDSTFGSWIHSIVYVRNVCAHHSRLWSRVMRITPKNPISPSFPWLSTITVTGVGPGDPPACIHNRTYFLLSMIIYLLNTINPKNTFKDKFNSLLKKYPMVDVRAMGFTEGWKDEPLWDWQKVVKNNQWYAKEIQQWRQTLINLRISWVRRRA